MKKMVNSITTSNERKMMMYRTYTENASLSSTQYLPPSEFEVGINQASITINDTSLSVSIPISNGTINDDGSNVLTGSNGGDNSTNNTVVFKDGGGVTDDTAQNLLTTGSDTTKTWSISNLAAAGVNIDKTEAFGLWFYVKDQTALDKIVTLIIKLGSDNANYFSLTTNNADLVTGWNWITSNKVLVEDLTETLSVGAVINYFEIEVECGHADDAFVAGDVIYDLLRQWSSSDLKKDFVTGYPAVNLVTQEVTMRCLVNSVEGNGFLLNGVGTFNVDTARLLCTVSKLIGESKSRTDEFVYIIKNRLI